MRRLTIIESPFAGADEATVYRNIRNIRYARACVADSVRRGEAPALVSTELRLEERQRVVLQQDRDGNADGHGGLLEGTFGIARERIAGVQVDGVTPTSTAGGTARA